MEYVAGAVLVLLGLLIVVFGSAKTTRDGGGSRGLSMPAWFDAVLKWAIGITCAWFGGQLLLGHAHYF
jgi:hypothetical protein